MPHEIFIVSYNINKSNHASGLKVKIIIFKFKYCILTCAQSCLELAIYSTEWKHFNLENKICQSPFLRKGGVNTPGPKCCRGDLSSTIILVYLPLEMWNE